RGFGDHGSGLDIPDPPALGTIRYLTALQFEELATGSEPVQEDFADGGRKEELVALSNSRLKPRLVRPETIQALVHRSPLGPRTTELTCRGRQQHLPAARNCNGGPGQVRRMVRRSQRTAATTRSLVQPLQRTGREVQNLFRLPV